MNFSSIHLGSQRFSAVRATAWAALASMGMSGALMAQTSVPGKHSPAPHLSRIGVSQVPPKDPAKGPVLAPALFCFGDESSAACPCRNAGAPGHGCENSAYTGGAVLSASGLSSLSADGVQLLAQGELPEALSIVMQGDAAVRPASFGDGVRCVGGTLLRLYVQDAVGGRISVPQPGYASISARSTALGDPIPEGGVRHYQVYYRDPSWRFCEFPAGDMFNASNGVSITWVR